MGAEAGCSVVVSAWPFPAHRRERGGEVRTTGLPGLGDPQGSSSCTIRKLAPLVLWNH